MSELGTQTKEVGTQTTKLNPLQFVADALGELRAKGVAPRLRVLEGEQKPVATFDGKEVINLASKTWAMPLAVKENRWSLPAISPDGRSIAVATGDFENRIEPGRDLRRSDWVDRP